MDIYGCTSRGQLHMVVFNARCGAMVRVGLLHVSTESDRQIDLS